jgi:hypothetical protein
MTSNFSEMKRPTYIKLPLSISITQHNTTALACLKTVNDNETHRAAEKLNWMESCCLHIVAINDKHPDRGCIKSSNGNTLRHPDASTFSSL